MPDLKPVTVLLLGGTSEGRELAQALDARYGKAVRLISSLAGVSDTAARTAAGLPGEVLVGGFGGVEGLARTMRGKKVAALVDATHPFAATISAHARLACEAVGVPRLIVAKPMWRHDPKDRWIEVADMAEAAARVGGLGRRAFLTVGVKDLDAFSEVAGVHFIVRLMTPQNHLPIGDFTQVIAYPPYRTEDDLALMRQLGVEVVVTKAAGGAQTESKILAARRLGLPVLMVRRPPPEPGDRVEVVAAAVDWLGRTLGL